MKQVSLLVTLLLVASFTSSLSAQDKNKARRKRPQAAGNIEITRDVEYGRAGDRVLPLDIYQPSKRNAKKLPAIVWIHGGGWRGGSKSSGGRLRGFVNSGDYVGFSVEYRLSGEALWPAQIHDCKAAIRWIRANADKYGIDPERIAVWGSSAGGHLVSLLGTSGDVKSLEGENGTPDASSRVTCVVDFCGPSAMLEMQHSAINQLFGKPAKEVESVAKEASPVTHVSKDDPPFIIFHGTKDRTVPFTQAELLHKKLKEAKCDVTLVPIEGGGHGIGGPAVQQRVDAFFRKQLHNQEVEVSGDPIKPK